MSWTVSGKTYENGKPACRTLRAYDRENGAFVYQTNSQETDGAYVMVIPDSVEAVQVIAIDDEAAPDFNAQIYDRVGTMPSIPRKRLRAHTLVGTDNIRPAVAAISPNRHLIPSRLLSPDTFGLAVLSGGVIVQQPTISDIVLSSTAFTTNAPIGTVIGTIAVTVTPTQAFTGTLTLDDTTNFQIVTGSLQTKRVLTPGNYPIRITATQSGAIGSPFPKDFTLVGSSVNQTITSVGLDGLTFVPTGAGPVNVGNVVVNMSPATPTSTADITLGGTDAASFQLTNNAKMPCAVQAKATTTALTNYSLTLTATQSGISNSPFPPVSVTVTAVAAGALPAVTFQNASKTVDQAAGYMTFGHLFKAGDLLTSDSLKVIIGGVDTYCQKDILATHDDGSVRHAALTPLVPAITHNTSGTASVVGTLAKGSVTAPSPAAPSASALASSGYDITVSLTFYKGDLTTVPVTVSALTALNAAISGANGGITNRLAGAAVNEFSFYTLVSPALPTAQAGTLRIWFNIRAYAGGKTMTEIVFDNRWQQTFKNTLIYDVTISKTGLPTWSAQKVTHSTFRFWHREVWDLGLPNPNAYASQDPANIQYDISYMKKVGNLLALDTSLGVQASMYEDSYLNLPSTGPLPFIQGAVTHGIGGQGGRRDEGIINGFALHWLLSQNQHARAVMLWFGAECGGIPWNFIDEATLKPVNHYTYHGGITTTNISMGSTPPTGPFPTLTWSGGVATATIPQIASGFGPVGQVNQINVREATVSGYNGDWIATVTVSSGQTGTITWPMPTNPGGTATANIVFNRNDWWIDRGHHPEANFFPYMTTCSKYYFDVFQHNANAGTDYVIGSWWFDTADGLPPNGIGPSGGTNRLGLSAPTFETRTIGWNLRDWSLVAWITPDSDSLKSYFVDELHQMLLGAKTLYIDLAWYPTTPVANIVTVDKYQDTTWQGGFIQHAYAVVAQMGFTTSGTSALAVTLMDWYARAFSDGFLNGTEDGASPGYNPLVYAMLTHWWRDPNNGLAAIPTWTALYDLIITTSWNGVNGNFGVGGLPPRSTVVDMIYNRTVGDTIATEGGALLGYPTIHRACNALQMTRTGLSDKLAIHAWGYLVGRIRKAYELVGGQTEDANHQQYQGWNWSPVLPNGNQLTRGGNHIKINTSGGSFTMSADPGIDQALIVVGNGTVTFLGSTGEYCLCFGDYGATTFDFVLSASKAYMFSGPGCTGAQIFKDGLGSCYMKNGYRAAAATFDFSAVSTQASEVANFRHGTDTLGIKQNLGGNGLNTAASIAARFDTTTIPGSTRLNLDTGGGVNKVVIFRGVTNMTATDVNMHA